MERRHWPSAIGWLITVRSSSTSTPGSAISAMAIGRTASFTTSKPGRASRAATWGTGPAIAFSTGTTARSTSPRSSAWNTASKVGNGTGWPPGREREGGVVAEGAGHALEGDSQGHAPLVAARRGAAQARACGDPPAGRTLPAMDASLAPPFDPPPLTDARPQVWRAGRREGGRARRCRSRRRSPSSTTARPTR